MNTLLIIANVFIILFVVFRAGYSLGRLDANQKYTCKKCGRYYDYDDWRYVNGEQAQLIAKSGYCNCCAYAIDMQS